VNWLFVFLTRSVKLSPFKIDEATIQIRIFEID
jgi:hypothetical protein